MISNLNILDTVEICITDKQNEKHYYKTKIQDIGLDNTFFTMIPSSEVGRPVIFFKEQSYELYAKSDEGILVWKIKYLGIEKVENIQACKFQAISLPELTQRREFFRQPVSVDLKLFITKSESDIDPTLQYEGRIIDLSGGGCAFMCNAQILLHSEVLIRFVFREKEFEFSGEILDRIDFKETKANWDYKYRVKWVNAQDRIIDNLIKLVFEQQREMLNNNNRNIRRFK